MEDFELLEDLASLGIHTELRQGIDWGYGISLSFECNGKTPMYFTDEAVARMCKKYNLLSYPTGPGLTGFNNIPRSVSLPFTGLWKRCYKVYFHLNTRVISSSEFEGGAKVMWALSGECGDSGFGSRVFRYQFRPRTVVIMQKRVEEEIRKMKC